MRDVADMLDLLARSASGQIFLINLEESIGKGIDARRLRQVFQEQLRLSTAPGAADLSPETLRDTLVLKFTSAGLWLDSPEPDLGRYRCGENIILSRLMTYTSFFRLLRQTGGPVGEEDPPEPRLLAEPPHSEIDAEDVERVRAVLKNHAWRDLRPEGTVAFSSAYAWFLPLSELQRRCARSRRPMAEVYRDVVGLCHLVPGQHLIRLDLDLGAWPEGRNAIRRRPHGACNGSKRFRVRLNSPCQWGQTVNLSIIARCRNLPLDGVPEMLVGTINVPVEVITAHYIGEIRKPAEDNDAFFLRRITTQPIAQTVASLKGALT